MADNDSIDINCPACGKKMKKVCLPEMGFNLDVCQDGCGGIYFDNREYEKVNTPDVDISPLLAVLEDKTFNSTDESEIRICPVCGTNMVKHFASAKHEIQIDECYRCGGTFLDYKELDAIRAQYDTDEERDADVVKELYSIMGDKLIERNIKYKNQLENSRSIFSKLIRNKYGDRLSDINRNL